MRCGSDPASQSLHQTAVQIEQRRGDGQTPGGHRRILRASGAALDHPVHPGLPETAYLKALTLQLD